MAQYNIKGIHRSKLVNILTGKGYRKSDAAYVVDNLAVRGGSLSWEEAASFLRVPRSTLQVWLSESKRSHSAYDAQSSSKKKPAPKRSKGATRSSTADRLAKLEEQLAALQLKRAEELEAEAEALRESVSA